MVLLCAFVTYLYPAFRRVVVNALPVIPALWTMSHSSPDHLAVVFDYSWHLSLPLVRRDPQIS